MEDLNKAFKVLDSRYTGKLNDQTLFHEESIIYSNTNERMDLYQENLHNKENILSVIGSGDQIIEMILTAPKIIECFDISIYAKYYLMLKLAAIKALTKEEYMNMFIYQPDFKENKYYFKLFKYKIKKELDGNYLYFWDGMFIKTGWFDMRYSKLFNYNKHDSLKSIINRTSYLEDNKYEIIKQNIDKIDIRVNDGDIFDLYKNYKEYFDLVYLSNIIDYTELNKYKLLLEELPLYENGIVLSYILYSDRLLKHDFNIKGYLYKINEMSECTLNDYNAVYHVYKKQNVKK